MLPAPEGVFRMRPRRSFIERTVRDPRTGELRGWLSASMDQPHLIEGLDLWGAKSLPGL